MIIPQLPSERLLFSTVRIKVALADGNEGIGTGFFFRYSAGDDKSVPVIITNRHVAANARAASFQLHKAIMVNNISQPSGEFFTVSVSNFSTQCIMHPQVDICAMPINPLLIEAKERAKSEIYYVALDESILPTGQKLEELGEIEEIVMAGYPIGLWDQANNMPIVRRGITAVHPALDFCGRAEGVIDAACYPGCSGSPILVLNEGNYQNKTGMIIGGARIILLGVLYGGPEFTIEGEIIATNIPMRTVPSAQMRLPMSLGFYVKAREIITLGDIVKRCVLPQ
ncbi:MAG: serine protease, partial [Nitrospirales bacterium]